jgi:hypothetical protein
MPLAGFEPTISAGERPQTYALDRAATGTGVFQFFAQKYRVKVYRTVILQPGSCSVTLSYERRLGVFEDRVLRRIFGHERDEVTGMEKTTYRRAL